MCNSLCAPLRAVLQFGHSNSFHFRNLLRICTQHPGHSYCASYRGVKFKRCYQRISDFTRDRSFCLTLDRKATTMIWRAIHNTDAKHPALLINTMRTVRFQSQSTILLSYAEPWFKILINWRNKIYLRPHFLVLKFQFMSQITKTNRIPRINK